MASRVPSSYVSNIQTLVNSLSFQTSVVRETVPPLNLTQISNNLLFASTNNLKTKKQWVSIFRQAAFFHGVDHKIGDVIVMVYEDHIGNTAADINKISTVVFTIFGEFCFNGLTLGHTGRFYAAVENMKPKHQTSNVRRAIAVSLLKMYSLLNQTQIDASDHIGAHEWDELAAGELASQMKTITHTDPSGLGKMLLDRGFLCQTAMDCSLLDVVYLDEPELIPANNKLVFQMGEQLDTLFDPLTEYSPEATGTLYSPPARAVDTITREKDDDESIKAICQELLHFQENVTTQQIRFLTKVVTPLREKSLKGKIPIKISELNEIFPPTIDEVTRMNCILLDSLTLAIEYGSFEMVKACGVTIPHFFKAYMRHEAALKTFSSKLKTFLAQHERLLPSEYRRKQVEAILHVSLNLLKLKLVLERLIETKEWSIVERPLITQYFAKSVDIIDSFGKTTVPAYDRRVFTPSGKILTEICEGWPSDLSSGWLRRKIISVLECKILNGGGNGVIILFSDYVVFAAVNQADKSLPDVKISDIIMNSLINEEQLTFIPSLKVKAYCALTDLQVYKFDENRIKTLSGTYELEDATKFITLLNKARILGKSTPFHLFKDEKFGFSVAHEMSAYFNEFAKSKIAMFLNTELDSSLLAKFDLFAAIFCTLQQDEAQVSIESITVDGEQCQDFVQIDRLSQFVFEKYSLLETKRYSSISAGLFDAVLVTNKTSLSEIVKYDSNRTSLPPAPPKSMIIESSENNKPLPQPTTTVSQATQTPTPVPAPVQTKDTIHAQPLKQTPSPQTQQHSTVKRKSSITKIMQDLGLKSQDQKPKKDSIVLKLSDGVKHTSYLHSSNNSKKKYEWKVKPVNFNSSDDERGEKQEELDKESKALKDFEATMIPLFDDHNLQENWGIANSARDNDSPLKN